MQVSIKDKQPVEATIQVVLPAATVDAAFTKVLNDLRGQVRIPGFRPGKVPAKVLARKVGEEALAGEVRQLLLDEHTQPAVKEAELQILGMHHHAGSPKQGEDFTFDIHADLAPEFELPDLSEIVIDNAANPVTDVDVEAAVEKLRLDNATLVPVDRPAGPDDSLLIESILEDGSVGSTMPSDMHSVSDNLKEQLVGRSSGDEVELVLQMAEPEAGDDALEADADTAADGEEVAAEDSTEGEPEEAAAAQPDVSRLKVRIVDVREKELPDADDSFASTLGFDDWQATLDYIRKTLQDQVDADAFEAQKGEFTDKILAVTEFEVPGGMLNQRKQFMLEQLADDLSRRGTGLNDYIDRLREKEELEEFEQDLDRSAKEAVRRDLVAERLMIERQTVLTDDEFNTELESAAQEEGLSVRDLRERQGEQWEANYRFMLQREKAVEEAVRENLAAAAVAALD